MNRTGRLLAIVTAISCAWLASCTTTPPATLEESDPAGRALQAESSGDFARAADLWLQVAAETPGIEAESLRLRAAESWKAAGNMGRAYLVLDRIDPYALARPEQSRYFLLKSEEALTRGDVIDAGEYLDRARAGLEPAQQPRYRDLEAGIKELQTGLGTDLLARLSEDLEATGFVTRERAAELMQKYEFVPSGKLQQAARLSVLDPRAASWAELIYRIRHGIMQDDTLPEAAATWEQDYPAHEIGEADFLEIARRYAGRFAPPARIAVLLPLQGGLATAGSAIRDGFVSAYLGHPAASQLRFYNTGDRPMDALAAYRRAQQDGADWIVGPVRQESVEAVAALGLPSVSTLALNNTEEPVEQGSAAGFYTLSLSQESEARAIAEKMLQSGISSVITLTADNAWGGRMEIAFIDAFVGGGGQISDMAKFPLSANDHSAELTRVLQIDASRQRNTRLQNLLGTTLDFQPRLRDDFDAFFLASVPDQARQIRPQLRFFEAGDIPLFAVSRVYSGVPDPTADRDLNGIMLPLSALQLTENEASNLPALESIKGGSLLNLFALGEDAWGILTWLPLLQTDPDLAYPGAVGGLSLEADGQLKRAPAWAVFSGGRPVAHDPAGQVE